MIRSLKYFLQKSDDGNTNIMKIKLLNYCHVDFFPELHFGFIYVTVAVSSNILTCVSDDVEDIDEEISCLHS